jgi:hypothetical protein
MRYLMFVLSLSAALYAQTPPAPASNQQLDQPPLTAGPGKAAVQPWDSGQSTPDPLGVTPAPGKSADSPVPKWRLLPSEQAPGPVPSKWGQFSFGGKPAATSTTLRLLPDGEGTQPAFVNRGFAPGNTAVLQQEGPCAIPLTNVLPPSGTTPCAHE